MQQHDTRRLIRPAPHAHLPTLADGRRERLARSAERGSPVDLLPYFGAVPTEGDVVVDRNRITAGPLTGSIDIALRLIQHFYGDDLARERELQIEYAPRPPFGVGVRPSPDPN